MQLPEHEGSYLVRFPPHPHRNCADPTAGLLRRRRWPLPRNTRPLSLKTKETRHDKTIFRHGCEITNSDVHTTLPFLLSSPGTHHPTISPHHSPRIHHRQHLRR